MPCFISPPHLSYVPGTRTCFIWLEFRAWIPSSPFLSSMRVRLNTICLKNDSPDNFFFDRHRMGHWIYYRVRAEQGPQTKFVVGTPNGMGFSLQLRQFSLPSRLQVLRCEFFELLSAIGSALSKHYNPIVRFRLPSHSAVSLCVRGIRCEWRTTKWINYWASRSTSSSALAMEISSSASIQKF